MVIAVQKPSCAIFLDIDGVIEGDINSLPYEIKMAKLEEIIGIKEGEYTRAEMQRAFSSFFDKDALFHLGNLIRRVQEIAVVQIVISSQWRLSGSVDYLRENIFDRTTFAHLVTGKTSEDEELSRGEQIQEWIAENPVDSCVILDDNTFDLDELFPKEFVLVDHYQLMTADKAEEAFTRVKNQLEDKKQLALSAT